MRRSWLHIASLLILLGLTAVIAPVLADTASVINVPGDQPTIQAAVLAAADGDTIVIAAGTYPGGIVITGKSLTLQGAGAGVTILDGASTVRVISSDSSLTLQDMTVQNGTDMAMGGGVYCAADLALTRCHILSNTVVAAHAGFGAGVNAAGSASLRDCRLANNQILGETGDFSQGAGLMASGRVGIVDCVFENNVIDTLAGSGGGLAALGHATIAGSQFISNSTSMQGGGAYFGGDLQISDSSFRDCRAGFGGGLAVQYANLVMTRTQFISNTAEMGGGGAAVLYSGSIETQDCLFEDNLALETSTQSYSPGGGGLLLSDLSAPSTKGAGVQADLSNGLRTFTTTLRGTTFLNNTATTSGGGVSTEGNVIVSDCRFEGNVSQVSEHLGSYTGGGALFQAGSSGVVLDGMDGPQRNLRLDDPFLDLFPLGAMIERTTVISNTATGPGGGMFISGPLWMKDCRFERNVSLWANGGGIYAVVGGEMADCRFISNSAEYDGGGASLDAWADIDRCVFERNLSYSDGGGLSVYAYEPFLFTETSDSNDPLDGPPFGMLMPSYTIMTDTQFVDNIAWGPGGGLSAHGQLVATDTTFERNWSDDWGGGASVDMLPYIVFADAAPRMNGTDGDPFDTQPADATLQNVRFISNTATYDGGGIFASGELRLSDGRFERNDCSGAGWGGGASAGWYSPVSSPTDARLRGQTDRTLTGYLFEHAVTSTVFCDNAAFYEGGALALAGSGTVYRSTFERNRSSDCGGSASCVGMLEIVESRFSENNAAFAGGAVVADAVFATNCLFADNTSDLGDGHAIYQAPFGVLAPAPDAKIRTSTVSELNHCTIANAAPLEGWAVDLNGPYGAIWVINTLFSQVSQGISVTNGVLFEHYNLFDTVAEPVVGGLMDSTSMVGSADFVDSASGDYHLGVASDAIDTASTTAIVHDLDLVLRDLQPDIGCYERKPFDVTVGPDPFCPSWELYYRWTYQNKHAIDAANVVVTYTLPANTCCPSAWETTGPAWSYDEPTRTVTWPVGTVAGGATVEGTLKVHTFSSLNDGDMVTGTFALSSDLQPLPMIAEADAVTDSDECGSSGEMQPTATPTITPTPTATPLPPGFFCLPVIVVS